MTNTDMTDTQIQLLQSQINNLQQQIEALKEIMTIQSEINDIEFRSSQKLIDILGRHCFGVINPPTSEDPESGMDDEAEVCWPLDKFDMRDANERNH
jgi:hypothetical protein